MICQTLICSHKSSIPHFSKSSSNCPRINLECWLCVSCWAWLFCCVVDQLPSVTCMYLNFLINSSCGVFQIAYLTCLLLFCLSLRQRYKVELPIMASAELGALLKCNIMSNIVSRVVFSSKKMQLNYLIHLETQVFGSRLNKQTDVWHFP